MPEGWKATVSFTRGRSFCKGDMYVDQLPGGKWQLKRNNVVLCSTYRTANDAMESGERWMK